MRQGVVVWLEAPAPLRLERLRADPTPRPLLRADDPAARLGELLAERHPLYCQADLQVQQGGEDPAQVAQQVLTALPAILKEPATAPEDPVRLQNGDGEMTASLN
jgi:shikimate kinase